MGVFMWIFVRHIQRTHLDHRQKTIYLRERCDSRTGDGQFVNQLDIFIGFWVGYVGFG